MAPHCGKIKTQQRCKIQPRSLNSPQHQPGGGTPSKVCSGTSLHLPKQGGVLLKQSIIGGYICEKVNLAGHMGHTFIQEVTVYQYWTQWQAVRIWRFPNLTLLPSHCVNLGKYQHWSSAFSNRDSNICLSHWADSELLTACKVLEFNSFKELTPSSNCISI